MDAGAVDLRWFGTACELLFGECMSSVSHGQHRLVRIGRVRTSNRLLGSQKDLGSQKEICARAQFSTRLLRTSDPGRQSCCRAAV
jgi:hypothetical protein